MWPFRRASVVLRVGAWRPELWLRGPGGLSLQCGRDLRIHSKATAEQALADELRALLTGDGAPQAQRIDVVVESRWMPVAHVDLGGQLVSLEEAEGMARHRLSRTYGPGSSEWQFRTGYVPGDTSYIAAALSPACEQAARAAVAASGGVVASIQPSIAWALQANVASLSRLTRAWWVWTEQDRSQIALVRGKQVAWLNAVAGNNFDTEQRQRFARIEAVRAGISDLAIPVVHSAWGTALQVDANERAMVN